MTCAKCGEPLRQTTITVTDHELWQCGDHDERPLASAFVVCSWGCLVAAALERTEPDPRLRSYNPSDPAEPF